MVGGEVTGRREGDLLGERLLGRIVGGCVVKATGLADGRDDGDVVGCLMGDIVTGRPEGDLDGAMLGLPEGERVLGDSVDSMVASPGVALGADDGRSVAFGRIVSPPNIPPDGKPGRQRDTPEGTALG